MLAVFVTNGNGIVKVERDFNALTV